MADKETLRIYKIYKKDVEEISWFGNTVKTKLLIKARTDTLDLNWRGRFKNRDMKFCFSQNTFFLILTKE